MYVQNGLSLAQTNARFSFCLSFLAAYDSLAEKACKQIVALVLCRVCQRLAWVSYPYSWKSKSFAAHFKLFVADGRRVVRPRANFTPNGRCLMLEGLNVGREVIIRFQPKVSISFRKQSLYFFPKATPVSTFYSSIWTRVVVVCFERLFILKQDSKA